MSLEERIAARQARDFQQKYEADRNPNLPMDEAQTEILRGLTQKSQATSEQPSVLADKLAAAQNSPTPVKEVVNPQSEKSHLGLIGVDTTSKP